MKLLPKLITILRILLVILVVPVGLAVVFSMKGGYGNISGAIFGILVVAFLVYYLLGLLRDKLDNLSYYGSKLYINGIHVDVLLKEFHEMFTEFSFAETEKALSKGLVPNSNTIAKNSVERTGGFMISKHHLSPAEFAELVKLYVKKLKSKSYQKLFIRCRFFSINGLCVINKQIINSV